MWAWVEPLARWTAVASLAALGGTSEASWSPVPVDRCHLLAGACGSHVVLWWVPLVLCLRAPRRKEAHAAFGGV